MPPPPSPARRLVTAGAARFSRRLPGSRITGVSEPRVRWERVLWSRGRQGAAGNGRASHFGKENVTPRLVHPTRVAWTTLCAAVAVACAVLLLAAGTAWAANNPVLTYTEGTAEIPFSFLALDPVLTTGTGVDQALQLVVPVARDLPFTAVATTRPLDFGRPAVAKEFLSFAWDAVKPRGTNLFISYSVDGGAWLPAVGGSGFDIPSGAHGKTIAYRVSLTTSDGQSTPVLDAVTIEYARWTGKPTEPPAGGGGGSSHQPGASHKPGSGSYTYPSSGSSAGTGGGSGPAGNSGGGSGAGGFGGGSGTGPGSGGASGSGTAGSTAGLAAATAAAASQAAVTPSVAVPSPPPSTPAGASQAVSGLPVDGQAPVTGVPFVPSGSSAAGSDSQPVAADAGIHFPAGTVALILAVLAVMLFVPWLVLAARLRSITGYDGERARLRGPFWPLRH